MGKNEKNQLKTGVILSYLNLAVSTLIPLFYTPIVLRMLGESEYGLYSLAGAAVGYLSLLSFGFGSTILRYLSLYRAKGETENEQKTFGFFLIVYSVIAVLVITGGVILSFNVERLFHRGLNADELIKTRKLVLIIACSSAVTFPTSVFSSVVLAHEQYTFRKLVEIAATLLAPAANLLVLYLGYASIGMAVASVVTHAVMLPVYAYYCFSKLKVTPRFSRMPRKLIFEMIRFSGFVFLATIVDMLFWSTDLVLLGALAGSAAVAVYKIGATFNNMVMSFSSSISGVLSPRVTAMVAEENENERFTTLFIKIGRLQYIVIALVITGFAVFGRDFILLWAGEAYKDAFWIAVMTMFPLCIPLIQNTGITIVTAMNKHAFRSIVYLVIAIANVVSTVLIIPRMGGIGAALCSGISYLLGQGLIMNLYYWKKIGIDIPGFWKSILRMSWTPLIMLVAGYIIMHNIRLDNWVKFFTGVVIYSVLYFVFMYLFAFDAYEKGLVRTLINKLKR